MTASVLDRVWRVLSQKRGAASGRLRNLRGSDGKFEQKGPHRQNEIDVFAGHWASDLSDIAPGTVSGKVRHFGADGRPAEALAALGGNVVPERMRILELGPLEGGHTYQFEKMGFGQIISVESNIEAFLKCLIVKNIVNLKNSHFLLGDFVEYLKHDTTRYDLIFCCGVLYHMQDPLELISLMAERTDAIYVWTHYHSDEVRPGLRRVEAVNGGQRYVYHQLSYTDSGQDMFWGGNKPQASFLSRDDIFRAFRQIGFTRFVLHGEELRHPGGPCLSISFSRA